jgi:hypothetical protein
LNKTKICYTRPKKIWRGCNPSLKRLMHYCELCWIYRDMGQVGPPDWLDDA